MNKNKNAIIFGGTGNLGEKFLHYLLNNDYNVVFTSSTSLKLKKIKKKFKRLIFKKKIYGIKCNFLKESEINKTIKFSKKYFKNLNLLINCNGIFNYDKINQLNYINLNKIFTINAMSLIIINKYVLKYYKINNFIKIISMGSSSSKDGFKDTISYCGSKHALLGIVKSLNKTFFKKKIINYCINVGGLNNRMGRGLRSKNFKNLLNQDEVVKVLDYICKSGNHGIPEEINIKKYQ